MTTSSSHESPIESRPFPANGGRSSADLEPACLDYRLRSQVTAWYLRYPFSSFLALVLAAAVTIASWVALIMMAAFGIPGELLPAILAWSIFVIIAVAQFSIMWYFRTGILTSIMMACVAWSHLAFIGLAISWGLTGRVYEGPEQYPIFLRIVCIAFFVAVCHGAIVGSRIGRIL
jgi:hypothetical protein